MSTQRFSHQREEIYRAVCASQGHPTAEMIYQQLKPDLPKLSLGTVYRNLHQLAQDGRLVELPGPISRFDGDTAPHTHFQCSCCGAVEDLMDLPYDSELDRQASDRGYQITGHTLFFTGLCPNCAQQAAENGTT